MYKIKYLKTGHIFLLPMKDAEELKENFPSEYKILEKNGKKFNDKMKKAKRDIDLTDIRDLVVAED